MKGPGPGASARPALLAAVKGPPASPLGRPGEDSGQSHCYSHRKRPDSCEVGEAPQEKIKGAPNISGVKINSIVKTRMNAQTLDMISVNNNVSILVFRDRVRDMWM